MARGIDVQSGVNAKVVINGGDYECPDVQIALPWKTDEHGGCHRTCKGTDRLLASAFQCDDEELLEKGVGSFDWLVENLDGTTLGEGRAMTLDMAKLCAEVVLASNGIVVEQ